MIDETDASYVDIDIDDPQEDIHLVYHRRKQVKNQSPKKSTHNSSLSDELKGVLLAIYQFIK